MPKTIEQIYQDIATHLQQAVSEEWSTIWILVEVSANNVLTLKGHYYPLENSEAKSFPVFPIIIRLFEQLRENIQKDGENVWRNAIFTLKGDGTFDLALSY